METSTYIGAFAQAITHPSDTAKLCNPGIVMRSVLEGYSVSAVKNVSAPVKYGALTLYICRKKSQDTNDAYTESVHVFIRHAFERHSTLAEIVLAGIAQRVFKPHAILPHETVIRIDCDMRKDSRAEGIRINTLINTYIDTIGSIAHIMSDMTDCMAYILKKYLPSEPCATNS